jgi:hypothetical protein
LGHASAATRGAGRECDRAGERQSELELAARRGGVDRQTKTSTALREKSRAPFLAENISLSPILRAK